MNRLKSFSRFYSSSTLIPWSKQSNIKSLNITSAQGPFIYSLNKKIVDFTSGAMVVNLGIEIHI